MTHLKRWANAIVWVWDHTVGWAVRLGFLALIKGYQMTISPLLPPSCRFYPSCSAYAYGSIRDHGSAKGLTLATVRLIRCNPWNNGGFNPVPENGRWLSDVYPDGQPRISADGEHVHS